MLNQSLSKKRKSYEVLTKALMLLSVGLTAALVLFLLAYVLVQGVPNITWELLSTKPSYLTERIGILPDILNTVYIVLATLLIVLPLGVGAAIYLTEYASNKKVVGIIEYAAETLSGIPSIIYGLVGMLLFSNSMGTCLMAGALTLVIMNLPTIMRTTQESLKTVPQSYREGAFGLGAGKWRVVRTVVLSGCVDGVITGCILSVGLTAALVLFLLIYVLGQGIPNITWELLSTKPSYLTERIGILPDILNTVYIVLATLLIVLPLGVGAAIYLTEYASNKKVVGIIEYAAETLSGIPSIIYGLVGMLLFSNSMGTCLMAGALTLVIMNLPTIMRTTQESLKTVPQSYREGAFGLGAGKWRVVRTVVLPGCVDGVITGCILSVGRILGESAALLFTAGFAHAAGGMIDGLAAPGATLTVALYVYAKEQGEFGVAFAIAAILMVLTVLINFAATSVQKHFAKRRSL